MLVSGYGYDCGNDKSIYKYTHCCIEFIVKDKVKDKGNQDDKMWSEEELKSKAVNLFRYKYASKYVEYLII